MAAFNYQWSSEGMTQPSVAGILGQLTTQLAELEWEVDALGNQPIQNDYYQQPSYPPNYYPLNWQNHPTFSWSNNQDHLYAPSFSHLRSQPPMQKSNLEELLDGFLERSEMNMNNQEVFTSELSYESEFSYQPPPPQEEKSILEGLLDKFIKDTETIVATREASIRDLENLREQLLTVVENHHQGTLPSDSIIDSMSEGKEYCEVILSSGKELHEVVDQNLEYPADQEANALTNCPLDSLPSDIEVNPRKASKEQCNVVTIRSVEKSKEAVGGNRKRLHLDREDDSYIKKKRIKICPLEKDVTFKIFKEIKILNDHEEGYRVYIDKDEIKVDENDDSNFLSMDEDTVGDDFQSSEHALNIKEMTKRRHEKIIFAIEPD